MKDRIDKNAFFLQKKEQKIAFLRTKDAFLDLGPENKSGLKINFT